MTRPRGQRPKGDVSSHDGIHVKRAIRWYGTTLAVDSISFDVRPGEIVGFLGPNGAGKSTVLKMISTWLPPSDGQLTVAGHDVVREPLAVRRKLGYLPEHNALYEVMRVDRLLDFAGRLRGLRGAALADGLASVVDRCHLGHVMGKRIHECSKGYRQRIGLAMALIHDPPVIVLDEPTHGLDPLQVVEFRRFILDLRERRAILFSSHIVSEVLTISDRLLVINGGRLLADEPVKDLMRRAGEAGTDVETLLLDTVMTGSEACHSSTA